MEQYISLNAIVAEIKRLREEEYPCDTFEESTGYYNALDEVSSFLNTLEVKEVDLEKESEIIANEIMIEVQSNKYHTNIYNTERNDFNHSHLWLAARKGIELGLNAKVVDANLWKSADGDDLPELEREVVVFTQNFPNDAGIMKVGIAHRPNPNGWDGRNILTGEVNHYTPKTYDKGGWNSPNIKLWLDLKLPINEEE